MALLKISMCDDEPLALDRLSGMLAKLPDVEIVCGALNGRELLDSVRETPPTLIFLDIEMPQLDGFDIVDALARLDWPTAPPLIVFVTAHPEHAAEAFDSGALDFISKPVRLSRLERALDRARTAVDRAEAQRRLAELSSQLDNLKRTRGAAEVDHSIWVRGGAETARLDMRDVEWIAAEGEYVRLHVGKASYLQRASLTDTVGGFACCGFVRVHRSAAINSALIAAVEHGSWGSLALRMESGARVPVGKKYRAALQTLLGREAGHAPGSDA